ncbi:hypothetical protein M5K25_007205 [Dendrobium thyrsiflorum]|uniref:Uncharacterized protein n=1 Tax=Dendrobium thyrsiflorum TaxID=117978 RepID=A0ABD0VDN1_DENTH
MVCLKTITAFLRSRLRHCLRSRSPDVSMNGPRDWSKIAPQSGTTFLLQQHSAPQDEKRQTLGVYGLKTDSWIGASWSGRLLRGGCYACCPLKECLEWWDYDSHRRRQTVAG